MKVLIIDGQGGGLGRQLVSAVKEKCPETEVLAVGTNSTATGAMLRAGADQAATGENSVAVASKKADVIMGPPVNQCDNIVVGAADLSMADKVREAVELLGR